jgi:hypothetical protein
VQSATDLTELGRQAKLDFDFDLQRKFGLMRRSTAPCEGTAAVK